MILKKNQGLWVLLVSNRYTAEQVEAPERVYAECPKPSFLRWQQLIRECAFILTLNQSKSRFGSRIKGVGRSREKKLRSFKL
ncbi:hypothetical protein AAHE18_04G136700 [Arachis hypogaea]